MRERLDVGGRRRGRRIGKSQSLKAGAQTSKMERLGMWLVAQSKE